MSHGQASLRAGGMLFLLDADGRVIASQQESASRLRSVVPPFGLQRLVEGVIAESRDAFAAGRADFTLDLPLAVRIFSLKHGGAPRIALYVEPARRRSD